MNDELTPNSSFPADDENQSLPVHIEQQKKEKTPGQFWEALVRIGLGESALRIGAAIASITLVLLVVWVMRNFYLKGDFTSSSAEAAAATQSTQEPVPTVVYLTPDPVTLISGITRQAQLHTTLPSRPRFDDIQYTVLEGDTLFTIADRFGLNPNRYFGETSKHYPIPTG